MRDEAPPSGQRGMVGDAMMDVTGREIVIRRAMPEEAAALTGLIRRSKAHWGYDARWLEAWREDLTLSAEAIERDVVYCAEVDGTLAGVCHLKALSKDEVLLDDLFVEPASMGSGVGGALWRQAVEVAAGMGARALVFGADPHARPFYEHMGAVVVGENVSAIIPGRATPRMRYELAGAGRSRDGLKPKGQRRS